MKGINTSFTKLIQYIESENFKGYDPYDTLTSWTPFHWLGKWGSILAIQFQKRNPINIRPLLGIKKFQSTKGTGLLLSAYVKLYKHTNDERYIQPITKLKDWLLTNRSSYEGNYCWGYDFPYATINGNVPKGYPTVIHHSYILSALHGYYQVFEDKNVLSLLKKSARFVLESIPVEHFDEGICFGYHPSSKGCCYNASLHAANCLAIEYHYTGNSSLLKYIESAVDFVTTMQKDSGVWYYSFRHYSDISNNKESKQIDFHQGFILESLYEIKKLINYTKPEWEIAIAKGLTFYMNEQFMLNGQSLWRLPKKYPVDIHNQAQGIITFAKLGKYRADYETFGFRIAKWTIKNMQLKEGCFIYQKHMCFKNKIAYMRWGQAWMLLAFATLLSEK